MHRVWGRAFTGSKSFGPGDKGCLSGRCTVAKRLIGSGCHFGGEWGRSRDGNGRFRVFGLNSPWRQQHKNGRITVGFATHF